MRFLRRFGPYEKCLAKPTGREVHKLVDSMPSALCRSIFDSVVAHVPARSQAGRKLLIGVGYALVCTPPPVLKSRGNRDQIAGRAQRAAPVRGTVFVLERGTLIIHPLGDVGRGMALGFFGEGMPRAAWVIAGDGAGPDYFECVFTLSPRA
jgi:hypothetical protein